MSLRPLTTPWFHPPAGHEKLWLGLALLWCFVMSLMMPYWHFRGKQNSTGEAYAVKPADFLARTEQFVAANRVGTFKNPVATNAHGWSGSRTSPATCCSTNRPYGKSSLNA